MWLMSNSPPARRTARCSSTMLEYWTGISQPPNSTSRPPSRWWAENKGVRLSISIWGPGQQAVALLQRRPDAVDVVVVLELLKKRADFGPLRLGEFWKILRHVAEFARDDRPSVLRQPL